MGFISWLFAPKEIYEEIVPFEFYQDAEGKENDYFTIKIDATVHGHTIKGECAIWEDDEKNIETGRVDCAKFLEALEKLPEKVVPVSVVIKQDEVYKTPIDTDYLADKTGLEAFRNVDYDLQVEVDGKGLIQ